MAALERCGLPQAWAGAHQWRILETTFGNGLGFLAAWRAWEADPDRPRLLHYVAIDAQPLNASFLIDAARDDPSLASLATQLAGQWFGLLPGTHRLVFEAGRVMLTLHVDSVRHVLRNEPFVVDTVVLGESDIEPTTLKAVARHCRLAARVAMAAPASSDLAQRQLAQCGFATEVSDGWVTGAFAPAWAPKNPLPAQGVSPSHCVVIGAGLAGAAAASSLALRGWRVTVLDEADEPAAGASGVPVALITPHFSTDDALLSRLSRSGVRATMEQARSLLEERVDWHACGVLEQREESVPLDAFPAEGECWSRPGDGSTIWHDFAGWIKPAALVRAWLAQDGITHRSGVRVERVARAGDEWRVVDCDGVEIERAALVVVAAALNSNAIAGCDLTLQPVRGQVSWNTASPSLKTPAYALNGNGHFIPSVPMDGSPAWFVGSSFGRDDTQLDARAADHAANFERLLALAPEVAAQLQTEFAERLVQAWTGVRCASSNRRPILAQIQPGLWLCTAMGSRGLTYAKLCAELLAARLHAEPLALQTRLADSLSCAG